MQKHNRTLYWGFALLALVISCSTYTLTVQPTVPFWDCGEFTAAAVQQQVPHPPGAPLFLILGKLFHLFPFGDDAWRVNLVSVVASAVTVVLLYMITVKVIRSFFTEPMDKTGNAVVVYGSSFVSAMVYTFSDTFWFNAVESEVYAASNLCVAVVLWLMMVWNERADEEGHERYLLLIAYVIGLSIGVHLLSILTLFSIVLLIYVRKYPVRPLSLVITLVIGLVTFYVTYILVIMKLPALFAGTLPFFRSEANEYPVTDSVLVQILGICVLVLALWAVWYGRRTQRGVLALGATSFLLIILGYSTYGHLLVRANSNPPMNENKPDNLTKLVSYLGREQYGEAPMWPRRYKMEDNFIQAYREYDGTGPSEMWTPPPAKQVRRKDGTQITVPDYDAMKTHTAGELAYMWDYQIGHMYWRYFAWNFIGRISDEQDAPSMFLASEQDVVTYTYNNGQAHHFPVQLWGVPFLFGLIGLVFHFRRDPKMASVWLVGFLMLGVLAAIYQNQQNPQPRERDYFYIGSFMIWAMWSGLGVYAILEKLRNNAMVVGGGVMAALAMAPLTMAVQNWPTHSRAGNYLPFDYAYNILQSVDKDAIVFTNGDNDTFPVWYLQDVAGVRRDVRVVNLSLGHRAWYIEQLKNRDPFGARRIPLSFSDVSLTVPEEDPQALRHSISPAQEIVIDVDRDILRRYTQDTAIINRGQMSWMFTGWDQGDGTQYYGLAHRLVADILQQTRFTRPVYFCTSLGDPAGTPEYSGLDKHLRLEGMAYRVCPVPQSSSVGVGIDDDYMWKALIESKYATNDNYSHEPAVGLKFRNLSNHDVYYDDVHRSYMMNYRLIFYKYAVYLLNEKRDTARAARVMQRMNELISIDMFPMSIIYEHHFAKFVGMCGAVEAQQQLARHLLAKAQSLLDHPYLKKWDHTYNEQQMTAEQIASEASKMLGRWDEAKRYLTILRNKDNSALVRYRIDEIDIDRTLSTGDRQGALRLAESLQSKYPLDKPNQSDIEAAQHLRQKIVELGGKSQ